MSKKSASAVVSGFGFAMQIGAKMDEIRRRLGVTEDEFHKIGTPDGELYLESMIASLANHELPPETSEVYPTYPRWAVRHLTPELEAKSSIGVENPGLGWHEKQEQRKNITGDEIFAFLLPDQETYQARWHDPIHRCISLADIQFYEENPDRIPPEWRGNWVYAWKSVVLRERGSRVVPCLNCVVDRPFVSWYNLDYRWHAHESAGLSAS